MTVYQFETAHYTSVNKKIVEFVAKGYVVDNIFAINEQQIGILFIKPEVIAYAAGDNSFA